ncbi:MAG: hypothetical protein WC889_11535 [Myxococcota bacterium]
MPTNGTTARMAIGAVLAFVFIPGCATQSELRQGMVKDVLDGRYTAAMARLDKLHADAAKKDLVMDLMDKGLVLHRLGSYEESNKALDSAKQRIDELYGVSVTDELASFAWNDSASTFTGEEFEKVMVNMIMAFNYLQLGKLDDAAVESRQINQKLQVWVDRLSRSDVKTAYKQDPFAQYLSGMIQEATGELNDAFRSYEDALKGYDELAGITGVPAPISLKAAVIRVARKLGHDTAMKKYAQFASLADADPSITKGRGRLIVIASLGEVAHKKSEKWVIPDLQGDVISVTYPAFTRGQFRAAYPEIALGSWLVPAYPVHDLSTLAIKELESKNAQVKGRAVAKALASYALKKAARIAAKHSDNQTVQAIGILANLALNVKDIVETADTRSWMTLPDRFSVATAVVEPGTHVVNARFIGQSGVVDQQQFTVNVYPGETRFIVIHAREGFGAINQPAAPVEPPHPATEPVSMPVLETTGGQS